VTADEKIEIQSGRMVIGSIQMPVLVMHEGGVIEPDCRMQKIEKKDEKRLTLLNSDKSVTE
jgi:cytoskeletal protein CcmA (bactofilin family)